MKLFSVFIVVLLLLPLSSVTFATSHEQVNDCSLAWDASPSVDVDGYRFYWGPIPGARGNNHDVGLVLTTTCATLGIVDPGEYFLVARAYNRGGESIDSNEPNFTFIVILPPDPAQNLRLGS